MFNFDPDRFVRIQSGAVEAGLALHQRVGGLLDDGLQSVHFAGAGGAGILMAPAVQLLRERSTLPAFIDAPAELVLSESVGLDERSLVVIPSLSGTTTESLEAARYCRQRGAKVLALTGDPSSPLAMQSDFNVSNEAADDTSCESFYLQSLCIALTVLQHRSEMDGVPEVLDELGTVPALLLAEKESFENQVDPYVRQLDGNPFHIITGAGNCWPEAHYYGMCILEEMQWIRTRPVHASDFFHGTLELVEGDMSILVLKGEGAARGLAERVERFVSDYSRKVLTLDSADAELPGLSTLTRALVAPAVLATMLERVSAHLEVVRDHPLSTRRYYRKVAY